MKRKADQEIIAISSDDEEIHGLYQEEEDNEEDEEEEEEEDADTGGRRANGGGTVEEEEEDDDDVNDNDSDYDDEEHREYVYIDDGEEEIENKGGEGEEGKDEEEVCYDEDEVEYSNEDYEKEEEEEEDTDDVVEEDRCAGTNNRGAMMVRDVHGSSLSLCVDKTRVEPLHDRRKAADSAKEKRTVGCSNSSRSGLCAAKKAKLSKVVLDYYNEALRVIRSGEDLEKLKVDHCKAYLRHYSLRLSGSKSVLIQRIQEHLKVKGGNAMSRYPRSTFTINCTGDACTGDVVLFKQRVYKKSHGSSSRHLLGSRVVAGRIVKESYGADKQHTFTVEVLWSQGQKQLPVLYPLIIKGRNLYRCKTFRQPWPNELDRKRVLEEKHTRGRMARDARIERLARKRCKWNNANTPSTRQSSTTSNARKVKSQKGKTKNLPPSSHGPKCSSNAQECSLNINASSAGIVIGKHGRNITEISAASGARIDVRNDPSNPTVRIVKVTGLPEQIKIATEMVRKTVVGYGFPSPTLRTN